MGGGTGTGRGPASEHTDNLEGMLDDVRGCELLAIVRPPPTAELARRPTTGTALGRRAWLQGARHCGGHLAYFLFTAMWSCTEVPLVCPSSAPHVPNSSMSGLCHCRDRRLPLGHAESAAGESLPRCMCHAPPWHRQEEPRRPPPGTGRAH